MMCCLQELYGKTVISVETGCEIGFVCDIEADTCTGNVAAIKVQLCGAALFKKPEKIRIPWENIEVIGSAAVLVRNVPSPPAPKEGGSLAGIFGHR